MRFVRPHQLFDPVGGDERVFVDFEIQALRVPPDAFVLESGNAFAPSAGAGDDVPRDSRPGPDQVLDVLQVLPRDAVQQPDHAIELLE